MNYKSLALSGFLLVVTACAEPGVYDGQIPRLDRPIPYPGITNQEIIEAAYKGVKTPPEFYKEQLVTSIYYVNTISITPISERQTPWVELCTDDVSEGRIWCEKSSEYGSEHRVIIDERETEKYFEYLAQGPLTQVAQRVHKCSYFDHTGADLMSNDPFLGTLKKSPVDINSASEVVEYIWFIRNYNNGSASVLSMETEEKEDVVIHSIVELMVSFGDYGLGDRISIRRMVHYVDKATGKISRDVEELETLTSYGYRRIGA